MEYPQRDYREALARIRALTADEPNTIAKLANAAAVLKLLPDFFWIGFYIVEGSNLVLGPFQGPVACTRIARGKGVCGTAWAQNKTIIVPDVHDFPGHIACNEASRSEIVVPMRDPEGKVLMVLDADSDKLNAFGPKDAEALEEVCAILAASVKA